PGDGMPGTAVVVAAHHAYARPIGEAAVVLQVEPARRVLGARDLVHALAPLGKRIGSEADADALVGGHERAPAVLAEIVAAGGDAEMEALSVEQDGVQAEAARPRLPLARVLVVADTGDHLPGVAAVAAAEERGRLDAAPQVLLVRSRLERPDVLQRAPVLLGKGGERFRLLEGLAQVVRAQDLHAEERIAARGVDARPPAARVDERGVDVHAGS